MKKPSNSNISNNKSIIIAAGNLCQQKGSKQTLAKLIMAKSKNGITNISNIHSKSLQHKKLRQAIASTLVWMKGHHEYTDIKVTYVQAHPPAKQTTDNQYNSHLGEKWLDNNLIPKTHKDQRAYFKAHLINFSEHWDKVSQPLRNKITKAIKVVLETSNNHHHYPKSLAQVARKLYTASTLHPHMIPARMKA